MLQMDGRSSGCWQLRDCHQGRTSRKEKEAGWCWLKQKIEVKVWRSKGRTEGIEYSYTTCNQPSISHFVQLWIDSRHSAKENDSTRYLHLLLSWLYWGQSVFRGDVLHNFIQTYSPCCCCSAQKHTHIPHIPPRSPLLYKHNRFLLFGKVFWTTQMGGVKNTDKKDG